MERNILDLVVVLFVLFLSEREKWAKSGQQEIYVYLLKNFVPKSTVQ